MKTFSLTKDVAIPALGLGTYKLTGDHAMYALEAALDVGYRHIDTASRYRNQGEIGKVIRESSIPREEIFITSKVWRTELRRENLLKELDDTLSDLETDYVDLYLIHWPNKEIPLRETLGAMEEAREAGKIRTIGVSNFTITHLEEAQATGINVVCNQVEIHPTFAQKEMREYAKGKGITLTAYAPFGQGDELTHSTLQDVADEVGRSIGEVVLAWLRQSGIVAIPRSSSREHIEENFRSLTLTLSDEQMQKVDEIEQKSRIIDPPYGEF